MDRIEQHEDDVIDLGVASVETQGGPQPDEEIQLGQFVGALTE